VDQCVGVRLDHCRRRRRVGAGEAAVFGSLTERSCRRRDEDALEVHGPDVDEDGARIRASVAVGRTRELQRRMKKKLSGLVG
jgi:hypothetical protein